MTNKISGACQCCAKILDITQQNSIGKLRATVRQTIETDPAIREFCGFDVNLVPPMDQDTPITLQAYGNEDENKTRLIAAHPKAKKALRTGDIQYHTEASCILTFIAVKYSHSSQGLWVLESESKLNASVLIHLNHLLMAYQNCIQHITKTNTDPLTGLNNRQSLSDRLNHLLHKKRRESDLPKDHSACLCLFDIDFFKRVNDDFGHLYGDEVLLLFSGLMKKTFRDSDSLFRYGGEEFIVLLIDCTAELALQVLERFRNVVADYQFPQVGHITASCGFVPMQDGVPANILIDRADNALYYAKEHGRNRVENYNVLLDQGLVEAPVLNVETELF